MNTETEIEWNSHIIKSGSVFGTYDFMISKGHTLTEMNYVIWGVEDNTNMPLIKAVASALDTHPDVLLKANPMSQAIAGQQTQNSQLQAGDMNTRMDGQRAAGFQNPQPTGQERMQAGQPVRALVAGARNAMSGGAYSQGKNPLNAPSPKSMKERYGVLADTVRHPVRAIGAKVGQFADGRNQKAAAKTDLAQRQVLSRLNSLNRPLTPKEQELHNRATRLIEGTADGKQKGTTAIIDSEEKSRNYGRRMRDIANTQWRRNNPDALSSEAPYPNEMNNPKIDEPALEVPADGEQPNSADEAAVEQNESEMNQTLDAMNDGTPDEPAMGGPETDMPGEEGPAPAKVEGKEDSRLTDAMKASYKPGGTSFKNADSKIKAYMASLEKTGEKMTREGLENALKGFRNPNKNNLIELLMDNYDITREEAENAAETLKPSGKEPIDLDLGEEKPIEEEEEEEDDEAMEPPSKEAADKIAINDAKANNAKELFTEVQERKEKRLKAASGGKAAEEERPDPRIKAAKAAKNPKEKIPYDEGLVLDSSDAIDSAWDYLTLLKGR